MSHQKQHLLQQAEKLLKLDFQLPEGDVPSMFVEKIAKASAEIAKTNERLTKLKASKKQMSMQVNIFKLKDKAQTSGSSLKMDENQDNDVQLAHDSVLSLKLQGISNLPEGLIPIELRDKVYIQVLIEDDTFNSQVRLLMFQQCIQFGRSSSQYQGF